MLFTGDIWGSALLELQQMNNVYILSTGSWKRQRLAVFVMKGRFDWGQTESRGVVQVLICGGSYSEARTLKSER